MLIARAVAQGADHLILDEPTNHLDIRYQVEILELVAGLGITVLAAIHDLSLAALFCDTVHLISGGRLIASGPPGRSSPPTRPGRLRHRRPRHRAPRDRHPAPDPAALPAPGSGPVPRPGN